MAVKAKLWQCWLTIMTIQLITLTEGTVIDYHKVRTLCLSLDLPTYVELVKGSLTNNKYMDEVVFQCYKGYSKNISDPLDTQTVLACQGNGEWDKDVGQCYGPISCPPLVLPQYIEVAHGSLINNSYSDVVVLRRSEENYKNCYSENLLVFRCQEDGKWNNSVEHYLSRTRNIRGSSLDPTFDPALFIEVVFGIFLLIVIATCICCLLKPQCCVRQWYIFRGYAQLNSLDLTMDRDQDITFKSRLGIATSCCRNHSGEINNSSQNNIHLWSRLTTAIRCCRRHDDSSEERISFSSSIEINPINEEPEPSDHTYEPSVDNYLDSLQLPISVEEPKVITIEPAKINDGPSYIPPIKEETKIVLAARQPSQESVPFARVQNVNRSVTEDIPHSIESFMEKYESKETNDMNFTMISCSNAALCNCHEDKKQESQIQMAEYFLKRIKEILSKNDCISRFALGGIKMNVLVETDIGRKDEVRETLQVAKDGLNDALLKDFTIDDLVTITENDEILEIVEECLPSVILTEGVSRSNQTLGIFLEVPETDNMLVTTTNHGNDMSNVQFRTHLYEGKHHEEMGFLIGDDFYSTRHLPTSHSDENLQDITFLKLNQKAREKIISYNEKREIGDLMINQIYEGKDLNSLVHTPVQKVGSSTKLTYGVIDYVWDTRKKVRLNRQIVSLNDTITTRLDQSVPCPSQYTHIEKILEKALSGDEEVDDEVGTFTKKGDSGATITTRPDEHNNAVAISTHTFGQGKGDKKISFSIPLKRTIEELNKKKNINATLYPMRIQNPTDICFGIPYKYEDLEGSTSTDSGVQVNENAQDFIDL